MADKNTIADWDPTTAINNDNVGGISLQENVMRPPAVNNAFREIMRQMRAWFNTNLFRVFDSTDTTKALAFDLTAIATATTRTMAIPNKNGTLALTSDTAGRTDVRRNRIVNGDMRISQESGNTLGTTNGFCPADQWFLYFTTTGAGRSIQRIQARTLAGSTDQLEYKCTTAKVSLAAGDSELITQPLEGSNVADCAFGTAAAKQWVDRFQVQLPAGTYHMHYANSAGNRHCAVPFVVSAGEANAAVVKSVVVPADTGGTWLTADGVIGMVRDLVLAAGSTYTGGTASTWSSSAFYAAASQANILSSTSNVARLADVGLRLDPDATGVYGQYEVGEVNPIYRSERYWWRGMPALRGAISGDDGGRANRMGATRSIKMAKQPIQGFAGVIAVYDGNNIQNFSSIIQDRSTAEVIEMDIQLVSALTGGRPALVLQIESTGSIASNARLA